MNNLSISIGTESQYSATSSQQFEESAFKQEGAGIFSFLFGSEKGIYATELVLRTFNDKIPQMACYIINDSLKEENKVGLNYAKQDSNGRTILHFLVLYSGQSPDAKQILINVLNKTDAKKSLNIQDAKKNTCAHYAMYLELDDIVKHLTDCGADLTIKNNEGLYIKLIQTPVKAEPSDIFVKLTTSNCSDTKQNKSNSAYSESVNNRLNNIVQTFVNAQQRDSDADTIKFNKDRLSDTAGSFKIPHNTDARSAEAELDTDKVMNMILKEFEASDPAQRGGSKKKTTKNMGKSKKNGKVTGKRKMITYSEMSFGGGSSSASEDPDNSDFNNERLHDIARAVNNKANEAHLNAIQRIKEILKLEDDEAKAVKAILYDKIKKEKNELTYLDRAVELEKMASDESVLKAIKKSSIKKMVETIKQVRSDKEKLSSTSSERPTEKSDKKKKRSQGRVLSYETSIDDSSSSSDSEVEQKSKKALELTDDSSTSSSSVGLYSAMSSD